MPALSTWVSIPADNLERAVAFYDAVLGTRHEILDCEGERMACLDDGAGCLVQSPEYRPSANGAIVSLSVADLDAALARATAGGGAVVRAKTAITAEGGGMFALVRDTEGNTIGLHTL